jgi:hypothetical protein
MGEFLSQADREDSTEVPAQQAGSVERMSLQIEMKIKGCKSRLRNGGGAWGRRRVLGFHSRHTGQSAPPIPEILFYISNLILIKH